MKLRNNWEEVYDSESMITNFKWQQNSKGYKFNKLVPNPHYK